MKTTLQHFIRTQRSEIRAHVPFLSTSAVCSASLLSVALLANSAQAADALAPASAPATASAQLQPAAERISDQAISADQQQYRQWQARIQALNAGGIKVGDYALSKAQCWLDVSLHEYSRNDRSAFPQQALTQSAAIIQALETRNGQHPEAQTPLINDAEKLREDLWARFAALKNQAGFACAAQKVACAEVELVHAGNEYKQQGWRHANPYIQIAEDLLQSADSAASACPSAQPVVPAVVEKTCPAAPVCQPAVSVEKIELAADALFKFDKHSLADLLPAGRAKIDEMMRKLDQAYAKIDSISLVGHTDRLGGVAYNQKLSERRAATIAQYLRSKGYLGAIKSSGKGKTEQILACDGVQAQQKLIACLQPNRRVMIEVVGMKR